MSPSQPLPAKENALFKKILKCYEHKQYKNGLKFAKQILSNPKFAEHGETLAMKGLTLNCLGRKEEAYDYVRRGLRNDLTSHVCWHVYGLLQRSDHKYDEAIKCYRNALKWDKDNIQILRDLSLLQIQMRDLEGYRDTRYTLFMLRPTQRASWIGFAMAYHLLKDYQVAAKILEEFRKTSSTNQNKNVHGLNNNKGTDYEQSELLLYQVMVYKEGGYYQEALDHLNKYGDSEICDKLAVHEYKAELLLLLNRNKEAVKVIRDNLIARNCENRLYYTYLEQALGLTEDNEEQRLKMYTDYQNLYPKSQMPFRLPLNFVNNPVKFKSLADFYLKRSLRKGQPALFRDLKPLYSSECEKIHSKYSFKIAIIEDLMHTYRNNLKRYGSFETDEQTWGSEDATCILFVNYYLAQHYDYMKKFDKALMYVNEALRHTPTLIELYVIKAKIYKHAGNIEEAVGCMDEAQSLDSADRYLNSKCAKYLLRANRVSEAEEMCSKFTREGVCAGDNLNEMQCMWFQSEAALAYQRLNNWGEALKKCIEIDRHFAEITEDQFDFHTYCMRKMTLRSYVGLLRLEDVLKSHPFYFRAAKIAIEVYLRLYDKPLGDSDVSENINTSNITPSELKKLISKQRKAKKKASAAAANTDQSHHNSTNEKNSDKASSESEIVGEKLIPSKLERPDDPLGEAIKFLKPLQLLARERIETHLLAFEIYYRKGKILLMLQSLKRAIKIDDNCPTLLRQLVLFYDFLEKHKAELSPPVKEVIDLEIKSLIGTENVCSALELNDRFSQRNKNSLIHRLESSKLIAILQKDKDAARKNASNVINDLEKLNSVNIEVCAQMMQSVRNGEFGAVDESVIEAFRSRCHQMFPLATHFMTSSEKKLHLMNNFDKESAVNHSTVETSDGQIGEE
ncbi:N-alpha-acetyltransferase 15: NatA auxiliary subunit-like protein [Dinothrombium tinctorium]|uniref:N-alpha-acetyltransferase 15: NatA auxiliary subunit-like protein n=1 Tax=Dinothrombium tinctorium TaxID=1965070 RepID=A0A3S3QN07_9ACAR|nr:N-alpha-acetyltransferase 15: NatA auxiliary subunit-like protein [Dinothrombium tinctorium]RWS11338.1 N-alpha-acetyltransferase 15: NatA auxiliary subunit-like protein [Dinothrombium tinctorium]